MFKSLKNHFIPHEGNEHRPHILRKGSIRNIIVFVIVLELFAFLLPTISNINLSGGMASVLTGVLSAGTNEQRKSQNLNTLSINPVLSSAAELKAQDMAKNGYFAHTSPEGKTPWYWLEQVGYKYQYAGENLAIDFSDSKDVTDAWMNSPTHKANIVKDKYTELGTGIANGMYEGKETVFVVQVYASPAPTETKTNIIVSSEINADSKKINTKNGSILGSESSPIVKSENVETPQTVINIANSEVKPAVNYTEPTIVQKIISSPRHSTNVLFYVLFTIILISLILNIFIKIKHHHPDLVTNGLVTLSLIGAVFVVNFYLTHVNMVIAQSINYENQLIKN